MRRRRSRPGLPFLLERLDALLDVLVLGDRVAQVAHRGALRVGVRAALGIEPLAGRLEQRLALELDVDELRRRLVVGREGARGVAGAETGVVARAERLDRHALARLHDRAARRERLRARE